MTRPRQILPGRTYLLTRRCTQRQLLLTPSPETNNILAYCLAIASMRFDVRLHAACFMSNHYHLVATDTRGVLPEFMRWLNEFIAKAMNASLGRCESLWSSGSYNAVLLVDEAAIIEKMAYTLANPVAAGLVRTSEQWPGMRSAVRDIASSARVVDRPTRFFRREGPLPALVELEFVPPPGVGRAGVSRFLGRLHSRLHDVEAEHRSRRRAARRSFLGVKRILRQSPLATAQPTSRENARRLEPLVSATCPARRREVLSGLRAFWDAYRQALAAFVDGSFAVEFPTGTWRMQRHCGAACSPP